MTTYTRRSKIMMEYSCFCLVTCQNCYHEYLITFVVSFFEKISHSNPSLISALVISSTSFVARKLLFALNIHIRYVFVFVLANLRLPIALLEK